MPQTTKEILYVRRLFDDEGELQEGKAPSLSKKNQEPSRRGSRHQFSIMEGVGGARENSICRGQSGSGEFARVY